MLKGLPPTIPPQLLYVLANMGHGETLLVCDRNHPAPGVARTSVHGGIIDLAGLDVPGAIAEILKLLPLDTFIPAPIQRMQVVGKPDEVLSIFDEVQTIADAAEHRAVGIEPLERFAFYAEGRKVHAVVRTSDHRPYACFILTKGVIFP